MNSSVPNDDFASKRRQMKRASPVVAGAALLAFTATFLVVRLGTADPLKWHRWQSKSALCYLRGKIQEYHDITGEFPPSLAEMEAYFSGTREERWGPDREIISSKHGNSRESGTLDGNGGWYYNSQTGELCINLNKPLKDYHGHYYRLDRNQRPCDW